MEDLLGVVLLSPPYVDFDWPRRAQLSCGLCSGHRGGVRTEFRWNSILSSEGAAAFYRQVGIWLLRRRGGSVVTREAHEMEGVSLVSLACCCQGKRAWAW